MSDVETRRHQFYVLSDVGCRRRQNQDNFLLDGVINASAADTAQTGAERWFSVNTPGPIDIAAVFDGMGGEYRGEMAALIAAEELRGCAASLREDTGWEETAAGIKEAMERAGGRIREQAGGRETCGTTATVLMTDGTRGKILHVGDSRAYRLRGGVLDRLTKDQTAASIWEEQGLQPPSAAMASQLLVFLGEKTGKRGLEIFETDTFPLEEGERFLICSDGLYSECSEAEIAEQMAGPGAEEICSGLVRLALEHGGRDNVTALVMI